MAWWSRQGRGSAEPEGVPAGAAGAAEEQPTGEWLLPAWLQGEEGSEEPEPLGRGEDAEPREEVKAYAASVIRQRDEELREVLAEHGLDLSPEGRPVIADPVRFQAWLAPADSGPGGQAVGDGAAGGAGRQALGAAGSDPAPNPQPPSAGAQRQTRPPEDLWEMDLEKLRTLIQEEAAKIAQPIDQRVQNQHELLAARLVEEAAGRVPAALAEYVPELAHVVNHPQFDGLIRQQLAQMDPRFLSDAQALASLASGLVALMDKKNMPAAPDLAAAARGAVSRRGLAGADVGAGAPGGASAAEIARRAASDIEAEAVRFLRYYVDRETDLAEAQALDATDEHGRHTIDAYKAALARARRASR